MELDNLIEIIIKLGYANFEVDVERASIGIGFSPNDVEQHNFITWVIILNPSTVLLRATSMACADSDPTKFREMCLYLNQFQANSPIKWFMGEKSHVMGELILFSPTRQTFESALNLMLGEFAQYIGEIIDTFELVISEP